jgi:uncharacterized membrane protein YcaP (DUF421 family)
VWLAGELIVLLRDGRTVHHELKRAGMSEEDLKAAMRRRGYYRFGEVRLAVLEVDGTVAIIPAARFPK